MSTLKQQKEWHERDIQVTCRQLSITRDQYNTFARLGKKLHKIYEDNCNGYSDNQGNWSDEKEAQAEAKETQITHQLTDLASMLGLYIYFQTDPRGATIYLDNKKIPANSYNNAHCIY